MEPPVNDGSDVFTHYKQKKVESDFFFLISGCRFKDKLIKIFSKSLNFFLTVLNHIFNIGISNNFHEIDSSQKLIGYKDKTTLGRHKMDITTIVFVIYQMLFFKRQAINYHVPSIVETKVIISLDENCLYYKTLSIVNHICDENGFVLLPYQHNQENLSGEMNSSQFLNT